MIDQTVALLAETKVRERTEALESSGFLFVGREALILDLPMKGVEAIDGRPGAAGTEELTGQLDLKVYVIERAGGRGGSALPAEILDALAARVAGIDLQRSDALGHALGALGARIGGGR